MSSSELGALLRACREAVAPEDVGLPRGERRRTPGLRRAELATLAGISVEYLTRLEQGRDRHPSPQILGAIADALRLTADERRMLLMTFKSASGSSRLCDAQPPAYEVRPSVRALLTRLEPTPAVVVNRLFDVLAYSEGYHRLLEPFGIFAHPRPNLIRFAFTSPHARDAYPEWDRIADNLVANLKVATVGSDSHAAELAEALTVTAGATFSDRFSAPRSVPQRSGIDRIHHPEVGELRLEFETLEFPDADSQLLIVYLPADHATSTALGRLTGRQPGRLRALPA